MIIQVKKVNPQATLPKYMYTGDAGCDVYACLDGLLLDRDDFPIYPNWEIYLGPGQVFAVPTGLSFAIQDGFECQVRSRSGLAYNHGVVVLNSPGTIDSGYRGEVKVILYNTHPSLGLKIKHGDRIAQLVFAPVHQGQFEVVDELPASVRGKGGFGSTGA